MAFNIQKYSLPVNIWSGERKINIDFPKKWNVKINHMNGYQMPVLSIEEIEKKIKNPIGCNIISEDAKGFQSAVIIVDDLTRPTQASLIAPIILNQLKEAGIAKDSIKFVMAQGAHRAHTRSDFEKKLGKKIVDEYPIFNHDPFYNCIQIGNTQNGTPVEINAEVMKSNFKVGIGGIVPHPSAGFGGGGKIIIPGVASIKTISKFHSLSKTKRMGDLNNNNLRSDIMEATKMAKLNFKVDAIFNYNGEIVDIFAGDPIKEHDEGVILAQKHYKTQKAKNMDIVIANACCKANEAGMVIKQVVDSLLKDGGILIIITNTPEGLAPHYVLGRWGLSKIGGCNWKEKIIPKSIKKLIVYTKYIDIGQSWWFGPRKEINWFKDWDKVVNFIDKDNKNVVIYPDATIQLIK